MIEGLREEFPGLFAFARRIRARIGSTSPPWAALAGIGASFLIGGIVRAVVSPLFDPSDLQRWTGPRPFEIGAIAGTASGIALALAAGGRRGAILFVAYLTASLLLSLERVAVGLLQCGPLLLRCESFDPVRASLAHWTALAGIIIGIPLSGMLRGGTPGANVLLEAAGAFAVASWSIGSALGLLLTPANAESIGPVLGSATFALSAFLPGIAAGYVLASRGLRTTRSAFLLLALVIVGWSWLGVPQLGQAISAGMGPLELVVLASPVIAAALAVPAMFVWKRTLAAMR